MFLPKIIRLIVRSDMKISEAIDHLTAIHHEFGDLPICGGYLSDDRPPTKFTPLRNGEENWKEPNEVFIE